MAAESSIVAVRAMVSTPSRTPAAPNPDDGEPGVTQPARQPRGVDATVAAVQSPTAPGSRDRPDSGHAAAGSVSVECSRTTASTA
jgi:hypothetical protein